ncbi:cation:dicarboxylate symporter family transporter [Quadrisphaera sp. DSM 44207]|uniref:cation:dicarboxylate symporter family transporter n=1 Tax=Quadrisphaera sp. DSM 44207 TaxID=1881057 RepID=UPI0008817E44|nr:cation:dicarboxylase symporter family transporter [Quadrisphaera sp. DSM 44207]SDQ36367.1 aerobic C4-dicarboxylate transport protein [Quadrisphaera sp. DSM 44207]
MSTPADSASSPSGSTERGAPAVPRGRDRSHWLYIAVVVAVVAGALVGGFFSETGIALRPLGTGFVDLIRMMISPVIFCTIVLGIGSIRHAATVGRVGALALGYFLAMSTFALAIGLVVGNLVSPGDSLVLPEDPLSGVTLPDPEDEANEGLAGFLLSIIPTTLVSPLVGESVLSTLFVALLIGFAIQALGTAGEPALRAVAVFQKVVFKVLAMIMWLAPLGAFGAIASVVGATGWSAIGALVTLMAGFYATCAIFIFLVLGLLLRVVTGVNLLSLLRYLGRELLLIVSTSSSETALPRLIAKMEHLGVSRPVVGITVPTGYSFNLDGTAIYLTMASLFIAQALGQPLAVPEQIGLLVFMIVASKGAAGVTGAGLATLAGGLQSHRPELLDGVGFIVGIDRFMSEARALTNFTGNAVATVLIGTWVKEIDRARVDQVLSGRAPFDESTLVDGGHGAHEGQREVHGAAVDGARPATAEPARTP